INRLQQHHFSASPFREVRILQNRKNTSTPIFENPPLQTAPILVSASTHDCVARRRGAHSTEQKSFVNHHRRTFFK
ncbi:MAG: hypothetical protein ACYCWA_10955, partial [Thiobacillus sp.]